MNSLLDFTGLINFWSHSVKLPPFPGPWMVKKFLDIYLVLQVHCSLQNIKMLGHCYKNNRTLSHQGFCNFYVLHHLSINTQKGLISYLIPASWGHIFFSKFAMNKNINDGTHSQCSETCKDHGPWVSGTHKEVNDFESLSQFSYIKDIQEKIWTSILAGYSKIFSNLKTYIHKISSA